MASRTPARTSRPLLVGGAPSAAPPERVCDMAPDSRPDVTPVPSPAPAADRAHSWVVEQRAPASDQSRPPSRDHADGSAQRLERLGTGVAQELLAPVALVVLADATGGLGQGRERPQEPEVGLVLPRHRTVAL